MKKLVFSFMAMVLLIGCTNTAAPIAETEMGTLSQQTVKATIEAIQAQNPTISSELISRGVTHAAKFWTPADGDSEAFKAFCVANFALTPEDKMVLFVKLQTAYEVLLGNFNRTSVALKMPLHLAGGDLTSIDEQFGAFEPAAHFSDDMFASKIAFSTLLNFPFYTLEEKNTLGKNWDRTEWAYARMGDLYTARIPAEVNQALAQASTDADTYIATYNIMMGKLRNEQNEQLFADNMVLISHWGLRDELKSNYGQDDRGLEKQRMIYTVMKHIVNQDIPQQVINDTNYTWQPVSNRLYEQGKEITIIAEPNTRYEKLHNIYMATTAADKYCPTYPTYIQRAFNQQMEVSAAEIEQMFIEFISSPQVKEVAALIESRLGRPLEPFDIWYDGFKTRSLVNEEELSKITRQRFPTAAAYENSLSDQLVQLNFSPEKAKETCSHIAVDASRGAGHAWGALMKVDKARLRTRVAQEGMDYKGYNIATHEFGHNVEQTLTLYDVDNYMMLGVPSTAFTEAIAFMFQKRDLDLLNYKQAVNNQEELQALDIFWGSYEIMGVALVDIRTWQWLYENPNATVDQLKATIIKNAKEVWNAYYAPFLGEENSPILGIYSHMIDIPLYLPNYPYGHVIEFQLEKQVKDKSFGSEILRIYPIGKLTPNIWMEHATNQPVTTAPLLEAAQEAAKRLKDL